MISNSEQGTSNKRNCVEEFYTMTKKSHQNCSGLFTILLKKRLCDGYSSEAWIMTIGTMFQLKNKCWQSCFQLISMKFICRQQWLLSDITNKLKFVHEGNKPENDKAFVLPSVLSPLSFYMWMWDFYMWMWDWTLLVC